MLATAKKHVLREARVGAPSHTPPVGQPDSDAPCYARQHGTTHLHAPFRPKDCLPAHLVPQKRPTRVQARLFMDAQIPCTYRPVSDVHSKDARAFRRQGRWMDFARDKRHRI